MLPPTEADVIRAVKTAVAPYTDVPVEEITQESSFEDLGVDSLDAIGIIGDLEDAFEVEVPNDDLEDLFTVGDAVAILKKQLALA